MDRDKKNIADRIARIRQATHKGGGMDDAYEAASLAQTILHDTLGTGHPLMTALQDGVAKTDWTKIVGACRTLITLFEEGVLESPRLRIAREIEGDLLNAAEVQGSCKVFCVCPV